MIITEIYGDLFSANFKEYTPAHCISSDCKMGAGIAVPMKNKFHLNGLKDYSKEELKSPTCIYHNGVMNLITKRKYWNKPTYHSLRVSLLIMKKLTKEHDIHKIVMPKIGSGLDKLSWPEVKKTIEQSLFDTDIEVLVYKK